MTAALCALAGAALSWPGAPAHRARLLPPVARPRREAVAWAESPVGVLAAVLLVTGLVAALSTLVVALLAGGLTVAGCRAWLTRQRRQEARRAVAVLTETLGAAVAELRAGRTAGESAVAAVRSCPDAAVGAALAAALRGRRPSPGGCPDVDLALQKVAAAVRLSDRTGCSLAAVLAALEEDLRTRQAAALELAAVVAGPKASSAVLAGLPVLGLLMGAGIGADPWGVLTRGGIGTVLLVVGVGLEVAGTRWSAWLVDRALTR